MRHLRRHGGRALPQLRGQRPGPPGDGPGGGARGWGWGWRGRADQPPAPVRKVRGLSSFFFFFVFPPAPSPAPTPPPSHFWRGGCGLCILNYLVRVEVPVYVCVRQRDPLCKDVPRLALPFRKRDARARLGERETASLSVSLSINSSCLLSSLPVRNGESSHVGLSTGGDEGRGRGKRGTNTQPTIANTHAPLPLLPVPALPPLSPRSVAVVHLLLLLVRRRVRHGGPGGQQEEDADVKPVLWRARGEGRKRGASGKHEPGGGGVGVWGETRALCLLAASDPHTPL